MGTGNRLSHDNQPAPMPRNFGEGNDIPHPEIIRMVDGRTMWDRNVATPFGDNPEDGPDGDEPVYESGY